MLVHYKRGNTASETGRQAGRRLICVCLFTKGGGGIKWPRHRKQAGKVDVCVVIEHKVYTISDTHYVILATIYTLVLQWVWVCVHLCLFTVISMHSHASQIDQKHIVSCGHNCCMCTHILWDMLGGRLPWGSMVGMKNRYV